ESQREEDALDVLPFVFDEAALDFAYRLERQPTVTAGVLETVERGAHPVIEISVARRELVAEKVEQGKVHRIAAVGVRGMDGGLHLGGVVEQQVEDVMTFVLVGA